jgi:hypothetical protein
MTQPRLKHFGWGREGEGLTPAEEAFVLSRIEQRFGPSADRKSNRGPKARNIISYPRSLATMHRASSCWRFRLATEATSSELGNTRIQENDFSSIVGN